MIPVARSKACFSAARAAHGDASMVLRTLLMVLALSGSAAAAAAEPVMVEPVRYAPDVATAFAERYGERERPYLSRTLSERIGAALSRSGAKLGAGGVKLETEVVYLQPNEPTFKELNDSPSLSPRSFRRGGARLRGRYVDDDGRLIASFEYSNDYQEELRIPNAGIWNDVLQGFDGYARRAAKVYEERIAAAAPPPA